MKDLDFIAPRPRPQRPPSWRMTQSWHDLLFAHWPIAPALLAPFVPAPLELDTFDGQAWVGIIAFRLDHIRLRGLPEAPFVRGFAEINLRTYVRLGDRQGVLFLSLDTDHLFTIGVARPWFHLPYRHARISFTPRGESISFASSYAGDHMPATFAADYAPCAAPYTAPADGLESWLTERYCYFAPTATGLYRCDIQHPHWRLQQAQATIAANTMLAAHGITTSMAQPLLHYARYMKALIWSPRRVTSRAPGSRRILSALPAWA